MNIVNDFKNYLYSQKNPASKITIKNYISDVNKFINWYEKSLGIQFFPSQLTKEVVSKYQTSLQSIGENALPAARSTKRYLSSLRKFSTFLKETGAISTDPFELVKATNVITDPFYLKEFNSYLFTEHASRLTMKNYMADIKQFLEWLSKVTNSTGQIDPSTLMGSIDNLVLEQYKMRLLEEAKLAPISINRKLSSLRRYTRWLEQKGILSSAISEAPFNKEQTLPQEPEKEAIVPVEKELPLTALQGFSDDKKYDEEKHYSGFGPIRLAQRMSKIVTLGADLLIFNPIASSAEHLHYAFWKNGQRKIFTSVNSILESSSYVPRGVSVKTIIPKQTNLLPPQSVTNPSLLGKIQQLGESKTSNTVKNFTKTLYAPLQISTKHLPWKQKLWHYLRYTRPEWYRKYHSLKFVSYLHFGIMMIAAVIAGAALYQTWSSPTIKESQAVLSAQATSPPRTLTFQGRLLDKTNTPITAETPLRFALYNSPTATGAALLWQEKQYITPTQNGNFSATLGMKSRLDQSIFTDNASLYIGIAVGDNQELLPRQEIPTTNYSANSQTLQGLKPITDTPDQAQNVLLALDSTGNLTIGGNDSHTFQATGGQFKLSGQTLLLTTNPDSNGNIQISPDGSGIIDLQKPIRNTSNYIGPGGIAGSVEVDDILSVLATSSSQSALVVNQNGSGDIISGRSNGIDKFRLDRSGNAFLSGDLILNGDTIGTTSDAFDIGGNTVNDLNIGNNASVITIGGTSGITSIRNSLSVQGTTTLSGAVNATGLITANGGLTIGQGQTLALANFTPGAIPFIGGNSQIVQEASNFNWDDNSKALNVNGSLCIQNGTGICGITPGTIYASNTTVQAADLAENYVSSQTLQPGDVVAAEGLTNSMAIIQSTKAYQSTIIGIVSSHPGITLNSGAAPDATHPNVYPLALQGRVPVNVSTINGPIEPGDDLTSSPIPGVAMKATEPGQVIGKALEAYENTDSQAVGKITAFVNLTYRTTPATITAEGNLAIASQSGMIEQNPNNSEQITSSITNPLNDIESTIDLGIVQAQELTTQSLQVATDSIIIGGQTLKDYITSVTAQLINQGLAKYLAQTAQKPDIMDPVASNSASTTDQNVSITPSPTPIASSSANLETASDETASASAGLPDATLPLYNSIASSSAQASASETGINDQEISQPNNQTLDTQSTNNNNYEPLASLSGKLTYIPNFKSDFATFNQGLIALGPTSLTDVAVSNTLTINNNLRITENSIDTLGSDLNIQPLRQGKILFMGGLVAIDTQGNLLVNGNASFAHDVSVSGQLAAGIIAPIPDQDLIINLKDKSDKSGSSLLITDATGSGVLKINQSGDLISSGEAQFKTVASNGFSIIRGAQADTSMTETVADGSAGNGVITAYETERTIITPYVTDHSLIYVTATSNTGTLTPYLARQTVENPSQGTKGSFTVAIPNQSTKNISFNWWIVN